MLCPYKYVFGKLGERAAKIQSLCKLQPMHLAVKAVVLVQLSKSQPLSNGTLEAARKQAQAASEQASKAPEKAEEIKQVRPTPLIQ